MDGSFWTGSDLDLGFGATKLLPECVATPITFVEGKNSRELRQQTRLLAPRSPGVYGMLDRMGQLIYVGKAKNLRTRLLSYFRKAGRAPKAGKIIALSRRIVWEKQPSEFASLQRELELIRRWRPVWNVQGQPLRRLHTYLCLGRSPAPHFFASRKPPARLSAAVGPLPGGARMQEAVRRLNDLFKLRDCPEKQRMIFADQGSLFPETHPAGCLRLEIGTCVGPCTGLCSLRDYQRQVKAAREFLLGDNRKIIDALQAEMHQAAVAQQFERAAGLRDRWAALDWLGTRIDRLRHAQREMSFVYPVRGVDGSHLWYLIHAARTVQVIPAPTDDESREAAQHALQTVYFDARRESLLDSYEHLDGKALVMAWFRKFPREKERALTPEQANLQPP